MEEDECEHNQLDAYNDVVEKVAKFLGLKSPAQLGWYQPRGGAIIPAQQLRIPVMWTLGNFMRMKHAWSRGHSHWYWAQ